MQKYSWICWIPNCFYIPYDTFDECMLPIWFLQSRQGSVLCRHLFTLLLSNNISKSAQVVVANVQSIHSNIFKFKFLIAINMATFMFVFISASKFQIIRIIVDSNQAMEFCRIVSGICLHSKFSTDAYIGQICNMIPELLITITGTI